jgi:hypothetical protein
MKKWIIFSMIFLTIPLIAQFDEVAPDESVSNEYITSTGLILAVEDNSVNFEEMWLSIGPRASRATPPLVIVDVADNPIELSAPCYVEITYFCAENDEKIPVKIKVLKEYEYDEDGMIDTKQD